MVRTRFATVLVVAALAALGGCSGDDDAGSDTDATTADGVATLPEATGASASSTAPTTGELPAPCSLLTADEVAAATGLDVVNVDDSSDTLCFYELGGESGVDIMVGVDDGTGGMLGSAAIYDEYRGLVDEGSAETIDGIGAGAVFAQGFRGIAVDVGNGRYFHLAVNGGYGALAEPREPFVALATLVADRL